MAEFQTRIVITGENRAGPALSAARAGVQSISEQLAAMRRQVIALFSVSAAAQGLRELARTADGYALIGARLKLAVESAKEYAVAQREIFNISQRTSASLEATAFLYSRVAGSVREQNGTQEDALKVTEAVSQALRLSGANAQEAAGSTRQLTQALGSGILRAEEFNSVLEGNVRLAQAIAAGLGISTGALRRQVAEGQIESAQVIKALLSQVEVLKQEFASLPLTIGNSFTQISTAFTTYIGKADQASGVSRGVAQSLKSVADNFSAVADAAVVAGGAIVAVYAGRAVAAIVAYVAHVRARVAVETAAIATTRAAAAADLAAAQAKFFHAQAVVNLTSGMARLTAVQAALIPAQRALTAAQTASAGILAATAARIGLLRGALALLGGPIGAITTALTLGVTAWAIWGNAGQRQIETLEQRVDALLKQMKDFARSPADQAIEELGRVNAEIADLAQKREAVFVGDAFRKQLDDRIAGLQKRQRDLGEAIGRATATGAAPAGPGLSDKDKQFLDRLKTRQEKIKEDLDKLDDLRRRDLVSEQVYNQRKAQLQKELAETNAKAAGAAGPSERLALVKAQAEAEFSVLRESLQRAQKAYDFALDQNLISIRDFYAAKTALEQRALDEEIAVRTRELEAQRGIAQSPGKEADRTAALREVARLEAELTNLNARRADVAIYNARAQTQAEKGLEAELTRVGDRLRELTGGGNDIERRAALERQYEALRQRLVAAGNTEGVDLIDQLIDVEAARATFDQVEREYNALLQRLATREQAINVQRNAGVLTESQARAVLRDLYKATADEIDKLIPKMDALARAAGSPELTERIEQARVKLQEVGAVVDDVAVEINDKLRDASAAFFTDLTSRTKSAKDAVLDFARSFVRAMQDIVARNFAQQIFGPRGSGGGIGGFVSAALNFIAMHKGGVGPGEASFVRQLSPAALLAAPRLHTGFPGLKSGEFPAILEDTEEVLTADDPRHRRNFRGGAVTANVEVNVDNSKGSGEVSRTNADALGRRLQAMVLQEIIDQQRPGGLLAPPGTR